VWKLIEQAMMRKGIKPTAQEFGKLTGLSSGVITKIKRNQRNIRYETFEIICEKLNLDITDLLSQ
jgi:transcriptional regulator with XRE-family HTH domain